MVRRLARGSEAEAVISENSNYEDDVQNKLENQFIFPCTRVTKICNKG